MKAIILIPAYKPDELFVKFVKELKEKNLPVLAVDDGSGEACAKYFEQAEELGAKVVRHPQNCGKGKALRTGFENCMKLYPDADGIVTADCDGQHTTADLLRVIEEMEKNPKAIVLGGRFANKDDKIPLRSRIGNGSTRLAFRLATGLKIRDTQTGLRGIPAYLFEKMTEITGDRYEYEMNMLLAIRDFNIPYVEIPIETVYFNNNAGSHYDTFKDSWRIFKQLLKYCASSLICLILDYLLFILFGEFIFKGGIDLAGYLTANLPNALAFLVANLSLAYLSARIISAIVNYLLNSRLIFKTKGKSTALKYALLAFVMAVVGAILTEILMVYAGIPSVLCKIIVDLPLFFVNYFFQREFVFKKK